MKKRTFHAPPPLRAAQALLLSAAATAVSNE
jgi:hypothetical protein